MLVGNLERTRLLVDSKASRQLNNLDYFIKKGTYPRELKDMEKVEMENLGINTLFCRSREKIIG